MLAPLETLFLTGLARGKVDIPHEVYLKVVKGGDE